MHQNLLEKTLIYLINLSASLTEKLHCSAVVHWLDLKLHTLCCNSRCLVFCGFLKKL